MYIEEKFHFFEEYLGKGKLGGSKAIYFCPKHYQLPTRLVRKLNVDFEKGLYHCFVCDFGGTLSNLVKAVNGNLKQWKQMGGEEKAYSRRNKESVTLPPEYKLLKNNTRSIYSKAAKIYLRNRGVSDFDINFLQIGYTENGNGNRRLDFRIIFPSYNTGGNLNYWIGRSFVTSDNGSKYYNSENPKNNIIFNELYIDWNQPIVLVEGIFDYIKAGTNSIPLLGNTLSINSILFNKLLLTIPPKIVLAYDNTIDGKQKQNQTALLLLDHDFDVFFTDLGNFKDLGETSEKEAKKILKNCCRVNKLDVIRNGLA